MKRRSVAVGLFEVALLIINFLPFVKYSVVNFEEHTIATKHYSMFYLSCVEYLNISTLFMFVNFAFIGATVFVLFSALSSIININRNTFTRSREISSFIVSIVLFLIMLLFIFVVL